MSDNELPISFADSAQEAMDASKSAGRLLREAREAKGLHVAALAVSLKVPVKKLEALEADRFEDLPDAVFVRALASSVCRALKIDADPVLAKLPQLNTRVLDQAQKGVNVVFRTRSDGPAPSVFSNLNRPAVLGVFALLLGALVIMLLPDFSARSASQAAGGAISPTASSAATTAGESMGASVNVPSTPASGANDATTGVVSSSAVPTATSAPSANMTPTMVSLTVTPALSTPNVTSPTLTISPLTADTPAVPVPADSVVTLSASGETWIEVRDADGKIIVQRTLQSGEKAGAGPSQGKLPLSVIVGRANLTQVIVRGKAFDLAAVSSKDAVARFQVK